MIIRRIQDRLQSAGGGPAGKISKPPGFKGHADWVFQKTKLRSAAAQVDNLTKGIGDESTARCAFFW